MTGRARQVSHRETPVVHALETWRTADEVESLVPGEQLSWVLSRGFSDRYAVGDGVTVTTRDGSVFIGRIAAVEVDLRIYVELS